MVPQPPGKPPGRKHKTRTSVLVADHVSRWVISISGLGTILAVLGVFVFLAFEVVPLFLSTKVIDETSTRLPDADATLPLSGQDRKNLLSWSLAADGTLELRRSLDGKLVESKKLLPGGPAVTTRSAVLVRTEIINSVATTTTRILFGFADGSVRMCYLRFVETELKKQAVEALPEKIRNMPLESTDIYQSGLVERTKAANHFLLQLETDVKDLGKPAAPSPVNALALFIKNEADGKKKPSAVVRHDNGRLRLLVTETQENPGGGDDIFNVEQTPIKYETPPGREPAQRIQVSAKGDAIYFLWHDDNYQRLDIAKPRAPIAGPIAPLFPRGKDDKPRKPASVLALDEDQRLIWTVSAQGTLRLSRLDTGELLLRRDLFGNGPPVTAISRLIDRSAQIKTEKLNYKELAFGFADGSVTVATFRINEKFLFPDNLPERIRRLTEGQVANFSTGLVVRTQKGEYRLDELIFDAPEPAVPEAAVAANPSPIWLIEQSVKVDDKGNRSIVCTLSADEKLRQTIVDEPKDLLNGVVIDRTVKSAELPVETRSSRGQPEHILMSSYGDQVVLLWEDGRYERFDIRKIKTIKVAETGSFLSAGRVTVAAQLIGRDSLVIGDSLGRARIWFPVNNPSAGTTDGVVLVNPPTHSFEGDAPVKSLVVSSRGRNFAAGFADGTLSLFNVTSSNRRLNLSIPSDMSLAAIALSPKDDGLLAVDAQRGQHWTLELRHPEITVRALSQPVWYEGYPGPKHVWQSSSGNDAFEMKLGMWPLVFGTLKASLYSLLFGVPLALLAAIYTSEFMRPRTKALVKPAVEMMASLPSVVLGFLAGLIFAQLVENAVPAVLASFLLVPASFVLCAKLVQLLPDKAMRSCQQMRFLFFVPAVAMGLCGAWLVGPFVEATLFDGDFRQWLANDQAGNLGGWMILFLPLTIILTMLIMAKTVTPLLRQATTGWSRSAVAVADLVRFLFGAALAVFLAYLGALVLNNLDFNPRGTFIGAYSQRNALVVGFVMGFAIIPIVYTIAEDALAAVPEHLRSGSLATGATQWQTAVRIVIPTAMSGLFSAVMIGLGRAVGETMIVVMATGNTPIMEWNIFNGFRTLSANIAVELPEAAKESTHYRTLFLAALVLFVMTFCLNTIAEMVRLRFRKRAYQL